MAKVRTAERASANVTASGDRGGMIRPQEAVRRVEGDGAQTEDGPSVLLQVANHVLSGAFYATRLYRDLREKTGLVYNVGASLDAGRTRSLFTISYGCAPANVDRARALVERDLHDMRTTAVSPAELQRSKALLVRQLPLAESSLARIADGLIQRSLDGLPLDEPEQAARRYLQTTSEAARAAFARWVRPGSFVQVTLGPLPGP
jgi:zinc protease